MQRSIADVLPTLAPSAVRIGARARVGVPSAAALAAGARVLDADRPGLLDPRRNPPGPYEWVPIAWFDAFKAAVAQWYSWGLMSVAIYWVNRKLPAAPDALLRRLLMHVPLSIVFTIAYTYLYRGRDPPARRAKRSAMGRRDDSRDRLSRRPTGSAPSCIGRSR